MSMRAARIVAASVAVALWAGSATAQRPSLDRAEIVDATDRGAADRGTGNIRREILEKVAGHGGPRWS